MGGIPRDEGDSMMRSPEEIRRELATIQRKLEDLVIKYRAVWPQIHENYNLLDLLYLREYEGIPIPTKALDRAASRQLVSISSIHRALRLLKKKWQTVEQLLFGEELEEAYRKALRDGGPPPKPADWWEGL